MAGVAKAGHVTAARLEGVGAAQIRQNDSALLPDTTSDPEPQASTDAATVQTLTWDEMQDAW